MARLPGGVLALELLVEMCDVRSVAHDEDYRDILALIEGLQVLLEAFRDLGTPRRTGSQQDA